MSENNELQQIQQNILERYHSNPNIRINVSLRKPKLELNDVPVQIIGVYKHIFQIEESSSGNAKRHTLQYGDVLTHNIEILDL